MLFHQTKLKDAKLIELEAHGDERGFFARTMCRAEFERHGLLGDFVQQNTSFSAESRTLKPSWCAASGGALLTSLWIFVKTQKPTCTISCSS